MKKHVHVHQVVVGNKGLEVRAWKDGHVTTGAIEVGGDRVLVA